MRDPISTITTESQAPKKRTRIYKKIKRKPIKENKSEANTSPSLQPSDCERSQNPSNFSEQKNNRSECMSLTLYLLQRLFIATGYGIETYWIALQILLQLNFSGKEQICFRISAAIFLIAGKFNESRRMNIQSLVQWNCFEVNKEEIINTQKQILEGIDFCIPIPSQNAQDTKELEWECWFLEGDLKGYHLSH